MKNLLCLISIFVMFLTLPVFAEYKPIPKELSKQYKAEMEQIINEEYPQIMNSLKSKYKEGKICYKILMKKEHQENYDDYSDKFRTIVYNEISYMNLDLYAKLVKITQEKYLGLKFDSLPIDCDNPFAEYLKPYFRDNNVISYKLNIINWAIQKKYKILYKYRKNFIKKIIKEDDKELLKSKEYKFTPKTFSKQYKKEIESIIRQQYPKIIKNIDDDFEYGVNLYKKLMKNGYDLDTYVDLTFVSDLYIPTSTLYLYDELTKVTQEKYLGLKYKPIGTDWVTPYENYLKPYLINNHVNIRFLKKIADNETKKNRIINNYVEYVKRLIPNEN